MNNEDELCIGHETRGIWYLARDIFDTWMLQPNRRAEFGEHETRDIAAVVLSLNTLLSEIRKERHHG